LGLALDPNFEKSHYLYLYYTYSDFTGLYNRVARFTESNDTVSSEKILIDKIPANTYHDGGRIKFGPVAALVLAVAISSIVIFFAKNERLIPR